MGPSPKNLSPSNLTPSEDGCWPGVVDDATPTSGAGKDTRSFQHNQLHTTKAHSRPFETSLTGVASDESTTDNLNGQILTFPPLTRLLLASILPPTQLNFGCVEGRVVGPPHSTHEGLQGRSSSKFRDDIQTWVERYGAPHAELSRCDQTVDKRV